jgi:hypothetical protein
MDRRQVSVVVREGQQGLLRHQGYVAQFHLFFLPRRHSDTRHQTRLTHLVDTLDKSKVTGIDQVDKLQDGVNDLVAGHVGKGGLFQPAGDMASKEGINRAERGGKDEKGTYGGPAAGYTDPVAKNATAAGEGLAGGAQSAGSTVTDGAKSAGGYLGGMLGGGKKE